VSWNKIGFSDLRAERDGAFERQNFERQNRFKVDNIVPGTTRNQEKYTTYRVFASALPPNLCHRNSSELSQLFYVLGT